MALNRYARNTFVETTLEKPFIQACENNKYAVADALADFLRPDQRVLEIGTGTGQHAVYFGERFPGVRWQTSDLEANHQGILSWLEEAQLPNVLAPIPLDINEDCWSSVSTIEDPYDAIYLSNVVHIIRRDLVIKLFGHLRRTIGEGGLLIMYGPFNYDGRFTSDGNKRLDDWLKAQSAEFGIREFEFIDELARQNNLSLLDDRAMPANNRLLAWRRLP
ncbi:MAG: DUF938 domain-containing protein [Gammaproteobacteria bacterium]